MKKNTLAKSLFSIMISLSMLGQYCMPALAEEEDEVIVVDEEIVEEETTEEMMEEEIVEEEIIEEEVVEEELDATNTFHLTQSFANTYLSQGYSSYTFNETTSTLSNPYVIELDEDVAMQGQIILDGGYYEITGNHSLIGTYASNPVFLITGSNTFVTIRSGSYSKTSSGSDVIQVSNGAALTFYGGTINASASGNDLICGIRVTDANLMINGGTISKGSWSVYCSNSNVFQNDGVIQGEVNLCKGSTYTMTGGYITNGPICVKITDNSTLNLLGGDIQNFTNAGVYLHYGTFNMRDGSIHDGSCGLYIASSSSSNHVYLNGFITNNTYGVDNKAGLNGIKIGSCAYIDKNIKTDFENSYNSKLLVTGQLDNMVHLYYSSTPGEDVEKVILTGDGYTIRGTDLDHILVSNRYENEVELEYFYSNGNVVYREKPEPILNKGDYKNLEWKIYLDGTLKIIGYGDMPDFTKGSTPWESNKYFVQKVELDSSITSIGNYAFDGMENLESITTGNITRIGTCALRNTHLQKYDVPTSVKTIGTDALSGSLNRYLYVPSTVTTLENQSGITVYTDAKSIPSTWSHSNVILHVADYYAYPVYDQSSCGEDAFYVLFEDGSMEIRGTGTVTFIPNGTKQKVKSLYILDGITSISSGIFGSDCTSLTYVEAPISCGLLGFQYTPNIISVHLTKGTGIGYNYHNNLKPSGYGLCPWNGASYKNGMTIVIDEGVTTLGEAMFRGIYNSLDITLPSTLQDIGYASFENCYGLNELTIPSSVKTIGDYALQSTSLTADSIHYQGCQAEWKQVNVSDRAWTVNDMYRTLVPAFDHEAMESVVEATCTEKGYTLYSCPNHADITYQTNEVEPLQHTIVPMEKVEPTCTEEGLTEGEMCSICKTIITAQEVIQPLGHDEVINHGRNATCVNTGLTDGSHCTRCNEILVEQTEIEALGHTYSNWAITVEPTCIENGQEIRICSRCMDIETREVEKLGHIEVKDEKKEPTCTETGLTEGSHCTRCNEIFVEQEVIKAKGHTSVYDEQVNPTCTKTGLTEGIHCEVCKKVLMEQEEIPALGHISVAIEFVKPTCTEAGHTSGAYCSRCNETIEANEYMSPLGHNEVITQGKEATCTETGLTDGSYCSRCNEILIAQEEIEPLGHNYTETVINPTEDESGYTLHKCTRCDDSYSDNYVPKLGHEYSEWKVTKEATCTETGLKERTCSIHNEVETEQIEALGHIEVVDKGKDATCIEAGLTDGKHCSRCNDILVDQEEIPPFGHDYADWKVTKEATCLDKGKQERVCTRCNDIQTEMINALGHDVVIDKKINPTCTNTGLTQGSHCARCHEVIISQEEIAVLGHSYGDWKVITKPTCLNDGKQERRCTRCNDIQTEAIECLGHDMIIDPQIDPTCTMTGISEGKHCARCNEVFVAQEIMEMINHEYGEWETINEPSCDMYGIKRRYCIHCQIIDEGNIDLLDHDYVDTIMEATSDSHGYILHVCSRCHYSYTEPLPSITGWNKEGDYWYFYDENGNKLTGWIQNTYWYYLDENGAMQTYWKQVNGKWYYLGGNGRMCTYWQQINGNWYYFGGNGRMVVGWQQINGTWYYFDSHGIMVKGWSQINGTWYYFDEHGATCYNWQLINNQWYYFGSNGKMVTGWQSISNKWYYFNSNGTMAKGWLQINGSWYWFDDHGVMVTGTVNIGGKDYKFASNGTWIS